MASTNPSVNIADVLTQFTAAQAQREATLKELGTQEQNLNASAISEQEAITREAELARSVVEATAQLTMQKEAKNKEAAALFGTNPEASNFVTGRFAQELAKKSEELLSSAAAIKEKQQQEFFDNPIEWIINQFSLPSEIAAHNTAVSEYSILDSHLKTLQDHTQEQVVTNNAIASSTNTAIAAAQADRVLQKAIIDRENARQKALAQGVQFANVRLATTHQQFTEVLALQNADVQLQQLQLARMSMKLQEEMREERLEALKQKREDREWLQGELDKVTAVAGLNTMTVDQYRRLNPRQRAAIDALLSSPDVAQGRLGRDPVEAVLVARDARLMLSPGMTPVRDKINTWMSDIEDPVKTPGWNQLKPEEKQLRLAQGVKANLERESRIIPDTGNIFSLPPLQSLGTIPRVQQTKLWSEAVAPLAKNQAAPTSAQQLFDIARQQVTDKKLTLDQAAHELAIIVQAGMADNNTNRQYKRFAIVPPQHYRTSIRTGELLSGKSPVDLSNETQVANALMRSVAAQRTGEMLKSTAPGFR